MIIHSGLILSDTSDICEAGHAGGRLGWVRNTVNISKIKRLKFKYICGKTKREW